MLFSVINYMSTHSVGALGAYRASEFWLYFKCCPSTLNAAGGTALDSAASDVAVASVTIFTILQFPKPLVLLWAMQVTGTRDLPEPQPSCMQQKSNYIVLPSSS